MGPAMKLASMNQRESLPTWPLMILVLSWFALGRGNEPARAMDGSPPRFTAPTNQQELAARVDELRQHYEPFLRSLPPPLQEPERTALPVEWKFAYEAKKSPKVEGVPPAPAWHGVGFDDTKWETTTVPEWRYRTREGDDTALDPNDRRGVEEVRERPPTRSVGIARRSAPSSRRRANGCGCALTEWNGRPRST